MPEITEKYCGIETEYAVLMDSRHSSNGYHYNTSSYATELLLDHIRDRRDLEHVSSGARVYNDHNHLELSCSTTSSAKKQVALVKGGDRLVWRAVEKARENGTHIQVFANNSDGKSKSYGGHINILISRELFDMMFKRRPHMFYRYWIPFITTAQVFTGAGKVGSENGQKKVAYQISQRADFMETALIGSQTTYDRPLVNSRDEALANSNFGRIHIICYDSSRMEFAIFMKLGTAQLVLAMLEAGYPMEDLTLVDGVAAMRGISQDPKLQKRVRLENGQMMTAIEIQESILERAEAFVADGLADGVVPDAEEIVVSWRDTLEKLRLKNWAALIPRIDWIAKLYLLNQHKARTGLKLSDPSYKAIDLLYASIDPSGLYSTALEEQGLTQRIVTNEEIEFHSMNPPDDSRDYFRGECVKRFCKSIDDISWDSITFRTGHDRYLAPRVRIKLDDPSEFTKAKIQHVLDSCETASQLIDKLRAIDESVITAPVNKFPSLPHYSSLQYYHS